MGSTPPDGYPNREHLLRAIQEQEDRLAGLLKDQRRTEDEPEMAGKRPVPSVDPEEPFEGDAVIEWDLEALRALEWDE